MSMNYDPRRPLTVENELGLQVVTVTVPQKTALDEYACYAAAKACLSKMDAAWAEAFRYGRSH
jgi:hypothetical protein